MSSGPSIPEDLEALSRDDLMSALFANMVLQQTNLALVFLGKAPHPETGQPVQDLEAARMFIDQLEMLAFKTRGNLDKDEDHLLRQSLMTLRMGFVEAVEKRPTESPPHSGPATVQPVEPASSGPAASQPGDASQPIISRESGPESPKRFTKKY